MSKRLPVIVARVSLPVSSLQKLALCLAAFSLLTCMISVRVLAFDGHAPAHLQCEGMQEPLGIDISHPRLSWQLQDSRRGARQAAYEIRVASSPENLAQDRADVWDSGRVDSDQSVNVPYTGPAVASQPPLLLASARVGCAGTGVALQPVQLVGDGIPFPGLEGQMDYPRHAAGTGRL